MWVTMSPASSPCSHLPRLVTERGFPVWVSSCPFTHPPSAVSPCIVQAVCLEKFLRTMCHMGSAWACLPHGLELLLPRPSLLVAFGLGHELSCLVSRPQPPWWDDPAGDVSKTRLCGKSDCMWFGPHFPGWGPTRSFSPQAGDAAVVSSLPHRHGSWPNLSFLLCPWSFLWPRQASSSQGSCGSLLTSDQ